MPDPRQLLLLGVVFAVPSYLVAKRDHTRVLKWICLTVAIDVLDPDLIVHFPAARVAGLLLLPSHAWLVRKVSRNRTGRALIAYFVYLVALGLLFGLLSPWSSEGIARTWTQLAPGRAAVYLIRKLADLSLIVFVAGYVLRTGRPDRVVRYLIGATSVAAAGSLVQLASGWDLYHLITGLAALDLPDRMRGLNYEPRGLGLVAAYGFALSLAMYARVRSAKWLPVILLHLAAISVSVSTSSLFAVGAGVLTLLLFDRPSRRPVAAVGLVLLVGALALRSVRADKDWSRTWAYDAQSRLTSDKPGSAPGGFLDSLALRMDLFDASALLFLTAKPLYLLVGTGPGLVGIPSTGFVPQAAVWNWIWQGGEGLNTVPHMGLLRELSDVGLIGLLLLSFFVRSSSSAVYKLQENEPPPRPIWGVARTAFLIAVAIYLVDASPLSAIESVLGGIGLGAALIVARSWRGTVKPAPCAQRGFVSLPLHQRDG